MSGYVCASCFDDSAIKAFIEECAEVEECSYCGRVSRKPIAAELEQVADFIGESIEREYDMAADWLPYESAQGGYQGAHWDTYDLLVDHIGIHLPNDADNELLKDLIDALPDQVWCDRNPFSLRPDHQLIFDWEELCRLIKHGRRYFFLGHSRKTSGPEEENRRPAEILEQIGNAVRHFDLLISVPKGSLVYRARHQAINETLRTPYELGAQAEESAVQANRMSPAGIVMFYGSDQGETAAAEIGGRRNSTVVIATFQITKDIRLLDLTRLPQRPSFFDRDYPLMERYSLSFLHTFVSSMSRRVNRKGGEHVDYVPTQVVTEWFRSVYHDEAGEIQGIRYPSSQRKSGTSVVLFADRDDLVLTEEQIKSIAPGDSLTAALRAGYLRSRQETAWLQLLGVSAFSTKRRRTQNAV